MGRVLGMVVGVLLLWRGLLVATRPRLIYRLWEMGIRRYLPEGVNRLFSDFFRLSDPTIRVIGGWVAFMGGYVLWLTSRMRD